MPYIVGEALKSAHSINVTAVPMFPKNHLPSKKIASTVRSPKLGPCVGLVSFHLIQNAAQRMLLSCTLPPEMPCVKSRFCHVPSMSAETRTAFVPSSL